MIAPLIAALLYVLGTAQFVAYCHRAACAPPYRWLYLLWPFITIYWLLAGPPND